MLAFELPEGYSLLGGSHDGTYALTTNGTVTCTCISGSGGCSPATVGGEVACVMTSCETCSMEKGAPGQPLDFEDYAVIRDDHFAFIKTLDQLDGLRLASSALLRTPPLQEAINALAAWIMPGEPNEPTKVVLVNVFNLIIACEVPVSVDTVSVELVSGGDDKISCTCVEGNTCPLETMWPAKSCNADDCKSCKMMGAIVEPGGSTAEFVVDDAGIIRVR